MTAARQRQNERFEGTGIHCNAMIPDSVIAEYCKMNQESADLFNKYYERYSMTARTFTRIQRVARTAADLAGHEIIEREDLTAAIQFRGFDSKYLN